MWHPRRSSLASASSSAPSAAWGYGRRHELLAYAARAFFANGGRGIYVSRVLHLDYDDLGAVDACFARRNIKGGAAPVGQSRARWPGAAGQEISVGTAVRRSRNVLVRAGVKIRLSAVIEYALVELHAMKDDPNHPGQKVEDPTRRATAAKFPTPSEPGARRGNAMATPP